MVKLLFLGFRMKLVEWLEWWRVLFRHRNNRLFIKSYVLLTLYYLLDNPFSVSRRFLLSKGETDIYQYGDTPLTTLQALFGLLDIQPGETVYELGAGAGFTSLWLSAVSGLKVVAVEQVPAFCRRLRAVVSRYDLDVKVLEQDYLTVDFSQASLLYLYASNLNDDEIALLAEKLLSLPAGARVLSVSYPLQPYCDEMDAFQLINVKSIRFPWGEAEVYLQVKTSG